MPRVKALRIKYMKEDAKKMFKCKRAEKDMKQKALAEAIELSPPAFSIRFKKFDFDFEQLVTMIQELELSDEEILKLMKI
ncbi:MAG: hypothetical protein J6A75_05430 [Lachnospiraceae bacterium]|nr:hypothetical protein [Lachnospiraceae bacterium]